MNDIHRTVLYQRHVDAGANIVEFGGWEMPIQYDAGILKEHLSTRKHAGLFDVSHMGRFVIRGKGALPFLQHTLSNNAAALEPGEAQYTMIPNDSGGALDDAYLYHFVEEEYLLVVNAANREKDWSHFHSFMDRFEAVELNDRTQAIAMLSLQGPASREIISRLIGTAPLPEPMRNSLSVGKYNGADIYIARTGYTGDPIGFELFISQVHAVSLWDALIQEGANPIGLGARDTLRLEAGLPLYGHELGLDIEDKEIPIFACPLANFAVSFSPLKGEFIGRSVLQRQFETYQRIMKHDFSDISVLPRLIRPFALTAKGVARADHQVYKDEKAVGYVTSATMVPHWGVRGTGIFSHLEEDSGRRSIGLALVDSDIKEGDTVNIDIRGKKLEAVIVPYHMRKEAPPYARPILYHQLQADKIVYASDSQDALAAKALMEKAVANTIWRQQECVNLIPSENTTSVAVRRLSILDPAFRYAEHRTVKAFCEADVFYYQGTAFIEEVEKLLVSEICRFLNCRLAETRVVSGQMANTAVFSAMVDYLNRTDRKTEPRRIRCVMNHHISKGGHLSAQPMGALRDFVMRHPRTEKPSVVNFPVLEENPFKVDVDACRPLIETYRPELIIFGRSMTIETEPVSEIRKITDDLDLDCLLMYDMAHVLGLAGPYYQDPFEAGADIVTASSHKTFFGPQRGIIAADWDEMDIEYLLWETIQHRTFPGSVSNHHLGTLLGMLMAAYEMNTFKAEYQQQIVSNAKAFAQALKDCGMDVAGDPDVSYTRTHQVIVNVGYAKGPETAQRLEENNIIVNYQATAAEEGFTAAGAIRMGVSEMTRFGMQTDDFQELAQLLADVVLHNKNVKDMVVSFRKRFLKLGFCFADEEFDGLLEQLAELI